MGSKTLLFSKTNIVKVLAPFIIGISAFFTSNAYAQSASMPTQLQQAWDKTKLPMSSLSVYVADVDGVPLVAVNPKQPRNPASVMKMVTTWSGLLALGPDYRWRTSFLVQNGGVVDEQGTLAGPLYIKAAGDPFFSTANLWEMLRELRLRGIKNLSQVVVDRSIFGQVTINTGAFDGASDRPYNASPDAMMIGHGAVRLHFQPDIDGKKWIPLIDPPLPGVRFDGSLQWRDGTCPGSPTAGTVIKNAPNNETVITLSGQAIGSCGSFSVWRLALTQQQYFDKVFRMLWRELGGTLAKDIVNGGVSTNAQPIVWHVSDSLSDLIRRINKQSNNVMARTLFLTIGAKINGNGATPSSSSAAALSLLRNQGVDTTGWVIDNGSGLSRVSLLTADGLASMLMGAWVSPLMPEFMSSLAISGVDGTVKRRLSKSASLGMAHLKTGTLRNSRALAGYVLGDSGKRYVLVSMVNHDNAISAKNFEDTLVDWLASQ